MADIPIGVANPTYNNANNAFNSGWFNFGDTRSDQDIANDQAVTTALGNGQDTFVNSNGITQTVASYERGISPPTPGSVYANANKAPTATGMLGLGLGMLTSGLIPGITGMIAGQGVNAAVNSMSNNSTSDTQAAQSEYEAAANAMEFPDNTPAGAISTLAGIGSGLLGGLQGKDEFGVYGQDSDFATNAADENSFEGYDGSEFGGSGSLGTSYGGMEAADFAAGTGAYTSTDGITEGLVGTVESLPSVAQVSEVDGSDTDVGGYTGWPGATPGFSSLSYHSMGMDAFNAMANSSAANSMAGKTGNAYNSFANSFLSKNPNAGNIGVQNAWEASRQMAEAAAAAKSAREASAALAAASNFGGYGSQSAYDASGYSGNDTGSGSMGSPGFAGGGTGGYGNPF